MPILNHTENVQISGGTFLDIAGDAYGVAGPMVVHDFIDEEGNVVAAGGNDVDEFEEGGNDDYEDHDDHDDEEERRQRPTGLTTTWPLDVGGTVINGGTFVDVAGNVYNIHHHHHYYYRRRRRSEESESDGECADKEGEGARRGSSQVSIGRSRMGQKTSITVRPVGNRGLSKDESSVSALYIVNNSVQGCAVIFTAFFF